MAVVSYKIKLVNQILKEFYIYSLNYIKAAEIIVDQNVGIINYIYAGRSNTIDANKVDTEYELDESALFESLLFAYKEACEGYDELDSIVESVGLIAIQEAGKLNLMQYVRKVVDSIAKVWKSFKEKMQDLRKKAAEKFTSKFKKSAENLPNDLKFEVQNVPELEPTRFNMVKVIPFNYEGMKQGLRSQDDFMKTYYNSVDRKDGESIKASLERYLTKSVSNIKVTKDYILNTVIPILETSDNTVENSVKEDIEIINKSMDAISRLNSNPNDNTAPEAIDTTTPEVTPNNASYTFTSGSVIKEDDVKFVDDPDRTAVSDKNSTLKDVSVYLTVSASIISTKLKLIRKKEITAFRILAHAFAPPKKKEA